MVNVIPNLHFEDSGQCFPLRVYEEPSSSQTDSLGLEFDSNDGWRDNISDFALKKFQSTYKDKGIEKEDIFYYVYGILHSPEYKRRFAANLKKMLPQIPMAKDFRAFSEAGRKLAELHLNYEDATPYPVDEFCGELGLNPESTYQVEKMRFAKNKKEIDKTSIIYNSHVTISGIPLEAYEYVVNGRTAIEWIMERYQVKVDKASQIKNDPNDWSDDPKYIVNLIKSVITVSVETVKIVKSLPELKELD